MCVYENVVLLEITTGCQQAVNHDEKIQNHSQNYNYTAETGSLFMLAEQAYKAHTEHLHQRKK